MKILKNQENNHRIKKLHSILSGIPREEKPDEEWQIIENDLFLRMDELKKNPALNKKIPLITRLFRYFTSSNKKIKTVGAISALSIVIFIVYIVNFYTTSPGPLISSKIVGISGTVHISEISDNRDNQIQVISENQSTDQRIVKNHSFESKDKSSLIAQLDKGSTILLYENSKITVLQADAKDIKLYLHKGKILASISKRNTRQTFSVVTSEATCKVVGTIFRVSVYPYNNTNVTNLAVLEGKVNIQDIENPDKMEFIKSGEYIVMEHGLFGKVSNIPDDSIPHHEMSLLSIANKVVNDTSKAQGIINLTSNPADAKIFIGDNFIGVTPLAINHPSGTYDISLEREGFKPWKKNIHIEKMYSANVFANLSSNDQSPYFKVTRRPIQKSEKIKRKVSKVVNKKTKTDLKEEVITEDTSISYTKSDTKDFGFILNPEFVKALIHMTAGEYQKALIILDSLKEIPTISITEKIRIMSKISACYKGLGNFENTLKNLTEKFRTAEDSLKKSNYLWEMITVKANCLEDYSGAEKDIIAYIKNYPHGIWIESAYTKLGEIQYITGKYSKAIGTFQYHINYFKNDPNIENSIYTIANIMRSDIKDCKMAIKWYSRLLTEFKLSTYYANALFERAECYEKVGMNSESRNDYKKYLELYPKGHLKNLCLSRLSKTEIKDK